MEGLSFWHLLIAALLLLIPIMYQRSSYFKYQFKMISYHLGMLTIAFFSIFYSLPRPRNRDNHMFVKWCTMVFLRRLCGLEITIRGQEHIKEDRAAIVVVNHQSSVDMIPLMSIWPKNCAAFAKKELFYAGTFGLAAWLCGTVYIDRKNSTNSRRTMDALVEKIREEKMKVAIFPEGTRNPEQEGFLPFKKGAFHIAVQAQVPVIPVVFSSYSLFYDKVKKRFDEGRILIEILPPVSTEGLAKDDVTDLTDKTKETMRKCFTQISEEVKTLK